MKHLLLPLLFILVGCSQSWNNVVASSSKDIHTLPVIIASGASGPTVWTCQVQELNSALVWVECNFNNHSEDINNVCIRVGFVDKETKMLVVESRKVCSGPLQPNENSTNYAAFFKEKRTVLQKCGETLSSCVMLTSNYNK